MPQTKVLLDSNAYFRLAKSIHPLLFEVFGATEYCLYVLKEMEDEWSRSTRLKNKFAWVNEQQYRANRGKMLVLSKKQRKELPTVFDFVWDFIQVNDGGPSRVDAWNIAYGYVLGIVVVTDDVSMRSVATEFGVPTISSLRLLQIMVEEAHINMPKVREVAAYWIFDGDKPANFRLEYIDLFGEDPPVV